MSKSRIKPLVIVTGLVIIAVIVIIFLFSSKSPLTATVTATIDTHGQPTLGKTNAPVHIVTFEDLKCPSCRIFNTDVLPTLKKKYIDTGKVKYTVITLAFIPGSLPAGNAALCLYQQNPTYFFPFIEYAFQHQPSETQDWATIPKLLQFARNAVPGANMEKLSNCIFANTHTDNLMNNLKIAQKAMGKAVSTPTIYVNGKRVQPLTIKQFDAAIKAAQ